MTVFSFDVAELREAFQPAIRSHSSPDDPEWLKELERLSCKRNYESMFKRLRRLLKRRNVSDIYESRWSDLDLTSRLSLSGGKTTALQWGTHCYWGNPRGVKRVHLLCLATIVKQIHPRSVLEVGCGPGHNLHILAGLFPDIEFTGVELTATGVAVARATQECPDMPNALAAFSPLPIRDETAHRRVTIHQGTAAQLNFPDRAFDLVVTVQAVEQMHTIRRKRCRRLPGWPVEPLR